jgi:hypothetical protein
MAVGLILGRPDVRRHPRVLADGPLDALRDSQPPDAVLVLLREAAHSELRNLPSAGHDKSSRIFGEISTLPADDAVYPD